MRKRSGRKGATRALQPISAKLYDKNIPRAMPWGYFARFTKRLVELRPVLTGGELGVVVVVGGFHDVIISPMPSPREPSATLHNGRKMPMEGFGVFQVRDMEECKRSVLEAIKAGYPVFEHRDLANICETTVLACCIPAFLDKLKNPAYTYSRQGFLERQISFHWEIPLVSRTRRLFLFAITHQSKADTPCPIPPPGPWGMSRHSLDVP